MTDPCCLTCVLLKVALTMLCCRRHNPRKSKYHLQYFDVRGLGEPIRMIFQYEGIPFIDSRVSMDEWPGMKDGSRTGMLPELRVDDKFRLTQSHAIARFLGSQFGLNGKDAWEAAMVDQYAGMLKDFIKDMNPYLFVLLGRQPGDKKALRKSVFQPTVARVFPYFVQVLSESKSGYLLPSGLTWVDFFYVEYLYSIKQLEPNAFKKYRELQAYQEKVHSLPTLVDYVKIRPKSKV